MSLLAAVFLFLLLVCPAMADEQTHAIFRSHCIQCHSQTESNGNVDLESVHRLPTLKAKYAVWKKVIEQVSAGTMPPETESPLTSEEKQLLLDWYAKTFDTSTKPDPGPPLTRQLTRTEYVQTIQDLLRIRFNAAEAVGLPNENSGGVFANRAGGQVFDSNLMEKYFSAADITLEYLFTHEDAVSAREQLMSAGGEGSARGKPEVRLVLAPFLKRAFRRPVSEAEVERFALLADISLDAGESFESSLQRSMKPVLVSPHFLLRIEQSPTNPGEVIRVSEHELATRLSYFLWGTMPDDELTSLADAGTLSQPDILEKQTRRLLQDPRAVSLTTELLETWLQLPSLGKALPNQNHFPTFTRSLREAMGQETHRFCEHMRTEDRSILDFLNADYTFVNAELAKHYRLSPVKGKEFVKVHLRPEDHRGGVLGMGSVLTMTSHSDRTKPTARGKWILEVLLGTPPPPPPANAGNFAPADKNRPEPKTFREKLGQHASDPNCVACHRRVDPMGFALENFDAIGNWRDSTPESRIDNAATLPGVGDFEGVEGLRKVLQDKQPQFVRNLVAQTLSYALGREVSYYDEPTIQQITTDLQANDYRFSTLILGVVKSLPFQYRKAEEP
ncbi:DUF1592 domain-containing protein [Planctomicrobium sp. SH661]|uniref:DUF1592 domain-containing protein n=1 Tax=Planctomicrobium sp. SH661 TaxID=3448124 RepID=UPI003F5C432C